MAKTNINSHSGFKYGITELGLIIILVVLTQFLDSQNSDIYSILIGLLTFVIGIVSIIGLAKSLRGLKEPNTLKKIIGIIINFGIVTLFIFVIISNILDIYNALIE
ncbi:hypothetical protein CJ739_535 [Mariniflexile rhizosphaerae]|uniref:hypothetical protein n=1 Tax=unclassified Mariniflexile TaxID=2643887 RepID=UPI000E3328C8|nr:hypothetical protein [Mariniflexile sp. TRM1-10]AXP79632.1 hypothetical protein CJ739_535 [Mariniflexile sp. TRM1-10]